jgi:hypothetical protein
LQEHIACIDLRQIKGIDFHSGTFWAFLLPLLLLLQPEGKTSREREVNGKTDRERQRERRIERTLKPGRDSDWHRNRRTG